MPYKLSEKRRRIIVRKEKHVTSLNAFSLPRVFAAPEKIIPRMRVITNALGGAAIDLNSESKKSPFNFKLFLYYFVCFSKFNFFDLHKRVPNFGNWKFAFDS